MIHLTSGDQQKLLVCIRETYSNPDIASFPAHIVATTSRIIPSGVISYASIAEEKQGINYTGITSCRNWENLEAFGRYMHEHPILNFLHTERLQPHRFSQDIEKAAHKRHPSLKHAPHNIAARISDVLTDRQFQSLGIFNEFFRRNGVHYQLLISFLPRADAYSMISFNRDKIDFSEKERLLLNLIQPHIVQAHKNAESLAAARQAFDVVERSGQAMKTYGLTYREEDVLSWVAQGKTNTEVARILNIAPGTVKIHLERIYQKLGVENRTAAAKFAIENNRRP